MIHVCVPVLKRYDLIKDLVLSLVPSTMPLTLHILDNGLRGDRLSYALSLMKLPFSYDVTTPNEPLGVAASWNSFIETTPEERVIANDDIVFAPNSLAKLTAVDADIAWAKECGFSCFLLRDSCVRQVGLFDVTISPGYGYYEDDDYLQRIDGRGTRPSTIKTADVDCGVRHVKSATLKANTPAEMEEHHRRFKIAQGNYVKKWGLEDAFEKERVEREVSK